MPEGPELYLASRFINVIGQKALFGGRVVKSAVSTKNPDVNWDHEVYRVAAKTRGKELKMTLVEGKEESKGNRTLDILFRFGMSGSFKYTPVDEAPKHAHLMFFTLNEEIPMVLSFVDYRRFGRWKVDGNWGKDRGPDPMWEYQDFRHNVLTSLQASAFNRPICEAMLNQKYFNGLGNYLRAEILYRCRVQPFDEAREVLSELKPFSKWYETQTKCEEKSGLEVKPDLLDLCHIVPKEVISLGGGGKGYNVDPDADEDEYAEFMGWLQCYYQDGMTNLVDHNKRTIWFSGHPGLLVPKDVKSRIRVEHKKKNQKINKSDVKQQNLDIDVEDKKTEIKQETKASHSKPRSSNTKNKYQTEKPSESRRARKVAAAIGKRQSSRLAAGACVKKSIINEDQISPYWLPQ